MELPEARDELVGMQEHPEQGVLGPQGNWTLKGFSHTTVVQQVLRAELALEQSYTGRVLSCLQSSPVLQDLPHILLVQMGIEAWQASKLP